MGKFEDFKDAALKEIGDLLKDFEKETIDALKEEGDEVLVRCRETFPNDMKEDIIRWREELKNSEIGEDYFKHLVKGKLDVLKMDALTQAGIEAKRIDDLREKIFDKLIGLALTLL